MLPELMTLTEKASTEELEEPPMVAIQRSRQAAEKLWDEICRLLAGRGQPACT
jgi:hypothetical protein